MQSSNRIGVMLKTIIITIESEFAFRKSRLE